MSFRKTRSSAAGALLTSVGLPISLDPTLTPNAKRHDDAAQFVARFRELVLYDTRLTSRVFRDHAGFLEFLESLRQQRRRHARHAAPDIVESRRAAQHFAQNEHGPPRTDDFRRHGDRTELSVAPPLGLDRSHGPPWRKRQDDRAAIQLATRLFSVANGLWPSQSRIERATAAFPVKTMLPASISAFNVETPVHTAVMLRSALRT